MSDQSFVFFCDILTVIFAGEEDKVKCFMCNVGLEKWEKNDIPWYQHLQWSKSCPYVEACKHIPHVAKIIEKGIKQVSFLHDL